jgi:small-conductance mechanosensitive channel
MAIMQEVVPGILMTASGRILPGDTVVGERMELGGGGSNDDSGIVAVADDYLSGGIVASIGLLHSTILTQPGYTVVTIPNSVLAKKLAIDASNYDMNKRNDNVENPPPYEVLFEFTFFFCFLGLG